MIYFGNVIFKRRMIIPIFVQVLPFGKYLLVGQMIRPFPSKVPVTVLPCLVTETDEPITLYWKGPFMFFFRCIGFHLFGAIELLFRYSLKAQLSWALHSTVAAILNVDDLPTKSNVISLSSFQIPSRYSFAGSAADVKDLEML